jgi:hypothetical protein
MKLAVAAGILAQTLPVISEKAVDLLNGVGQEKKFDLASILASLPREQVPVDGLYRYGKQRRDRGGRRTQASLQKQLQGKKTGPLMSKPLFPENEKPCNPSSKDADVGILSCGKGKYCEEDETVFLGGKCTSRVAPEGNSLGMSKTALASFGKGGILKNIREAANKAAAAKGTLECDPSTGNSVDVGILSCGEGKQCLPSPDSSRGGFCAPEAPASRQLYHLTAEAGLCDPTHPDYLTYDCDCTGFDNATGTGDIPCTVIEDYCLGLVYTGCADTCLTRTVGYTFDNFTSPGYSFCFDFSTPYAQKICFEEFFETDTCEVSFNDQPCTSCELVGTGNSSAIAFDCVNAGGNEGSTEYGLAELLPIIDTCYIPGYNEECTLCPESTAFNFYSYDTVVDIPELGEFNCRQLYYSSYQYYGISEGYCPAVAAATADACCSFYCELCDPGSSIPESNYEIELNVPVAGYEGLTCGGLAYASYYNYTISRDTCPSAASIAEPCCEAFEIACDLCEGGGDLNPTATFPIEGNEIPCIVLAVNLNSTDCDVVRPLVAETCCVLPVPDTAAPTPVPEPEPTRAPSGAAAGLLSTRTLASMVGLVAAAVAFAMN